MTPSEFSYDKNCWKLVKLLCCRKAHSFQTINDIDSKFYSKNWRFEWRLCQNFTSLSLILSDKSAVKDCYGRVGLGRFINLNDSGSPEMVITCTAAWIKNHFRRTSEHNQIYIITWNSHFFTRSNPFFIKFKSSFQ